MGETGPERAKRGKGMQLAVIGAVAIASAAALYVIGRQVLKPAAQPAVAVSAPAAPKAAQGGFADLATGQMKRLSAEFAGTPAPTHGFVDAAGKPVALADFKGQPMLVNLWATWCAPCKKEMPTLAALQKQYEGKVKVVALSIDKADQTEEAKAFIAANAPLAFYQEATMKIPFEFKPPAQGFPTTIFYDANGVEQARLVAEADWSTPEAHAVVDRLIGR